MACIGWMHRCISGSIPLRLLGIHRPPRPPADPREHGRRPRAACGIGRRAGESDDRLTHARAAAGGALTLLCVVKRYFMIEFWLGDWVVGGQVPWSEGGSGGS